MSNALGAWVFFSTPPPPPPLCPGGGGGGQWGSSLIGALEKRAWDRGESARTHAVNEQWAWRMVDMFARVHVQPVRLALLGVRLPRHRVGSLTFTYQYSYCFSFHSRNLQGFELDNRKQCPTNFAFEDN